MIMPSITSLCLLFFGTAVLSYVSPVFCKAANAILSNLLSVAVHAYVLVEVVVYFALRFSIWLLELLLFPLAEPRQHRRLRRCMLAARNYDEWLLYAKALDKLQGRSSTAQNDNDSNTDIPETLQNTHNWTHMEELIQSFRQARMSNDILLAAALVQQCAKRNVEGVLDESLYAKTHTGQPPAKVTELIEEIATTMEWLTDIATTRKNSDTSETTNANIIDAYQAIMSMATLHSVNTPQDGNNDNKNNHDGARRKQRSASMTSIQQHVAGGSIGSTLLAEEMKRSLHRLRVSYGRTALCLSGGAALAYLHLGHLLGLLETNCMPNIVSGSSAGALFAAAVCSKTDQELIEYVQPATVCRTINPFGKPWIQRFVDLWKCGHMNMSQDFRRTIKAGIGRTGPDDDDMTFEEAFKKTGRVLCVTLSPLCRKSPPVLLNHLTAPQVVISSAVIASCAVPGLVPKMRLRYKDKQGVVHDYEGVHQAYIDGSIRNDIPTDALAEMLNVQFCIVAQVNPHILPFYNNSGTVGSPSAWGVGSWRGGFSFAALEFFLKVDMQSKLVFLDQMGASSTWTRCMTQLFGGSCNLVPDYELSDLLGVIDNPSLEKTESMFQRGAIAAYRNATLIKTHYRLADAIESCLLKLEGGDFHFAIPSERPTILLRDKKIIKPSALPPSLTTVIDNSEKKKKTKRVAFFSSVLE